MAQKKKTALLSNYSWVYNSSRIAKKYFSQDDFVLITKNTKDLAKKHDFGMPVIMIEDFFSESIFVRPSHVKKSHFEKVIVDYSFNVHTILLLLFLGRRRLYMIDCNDYRTVYPLTAMAFMRLVIKKVPYFFNKALIRISEKLKITIGLGAPSELYIETTSACNLKCLGCPTGLGQLNRPPMMIAPELFGNILDKNRENFKFFDVIYPFLYGEPLLNKDIFGYIENLRSAAPPYARIELHTNGNIRNSKEIIPRLLNTGLDFINIAVDGTDSTSYESFRRGGDFDLLCEFVKNLTTTRKESGLVRPEIVVQMILTKYSEDKMEQFEKLKNELGADRLVFKDFFYEFTGLTPEEARMITPRQNELGLKEKEKKEIIRNKKNLCGWPYRAITITCQGCVTPCCIDSNSSLLNGLSICDSTVARVWNSAQYRRFRRDMLRGKIELCNKCFLS